MASCARAPSARSRAPAASQARLVLIAHDGAVGGAPLQRRADLGSVLRSVPPPGAAPRSQRLPRARQLRAALQLPVLGHDGCAVGRVRRSQRTGQETTCSFSSTAAPASTDGLSCLPAPLGCLGASAAARLLLLAGSGVSSSGSSTPAQSAEASWSAYGGDSQAVPGRSTRSGASAGRRAARGETRWRVDWGPAELEGQPRGTGMVCSMCTLRPTLLGPCVRPNGAAHAGPSPCSQSHSTAPWSQTVHNAGLRGAACFVRQLPRL
jgi:hypothetical protein